MDDIPTCPPWWPRLLWDLHFHPRPWPGPGPINMPPAIEDLMASLHIHTLSYLMMDQGPAQEIRAVAEKQLTRVVQDLDKLHQEASAKRKKG